MTPLKGLDRGDLQLGESSWVTAAESPGCELGGGFKHCFIFIPIC